MTRKLVVIVALAVFIATCAAPRRAAADTDNLVYIIPAAVSGVVAVIVIVAILMADRTDPEFELQPLPADPPPDGLKLAPDCAPTETGRPLLCW